MTITILHLYYDLMNLYGENGNIKAIKNYLEQLNIKVKIKFVSINEDIDFSDIDIMYIGSGTEENQLKVLKHLIKYKKEIEKYIKKNKFLLATGNAIELFGKNIKYQNKSYRALNIFEYTTVINDFRIVDECIYKIESIKEPIIGFTNHYGTIKELNNPMFKTIKGTGSYPKSKTEGINYLNFYGTYLIGPLLVRNPSLLKYLLNKVIKEKNHDYKIKKVNLNLEYKAYENYIKKYNI